MNFSECVGCVDFPCLDVKKECYVIPDVEVNPDQIRIFMVSEAPPLKPEDYFYAEGNPFYMQTTAEAFQDAGFEVTSMEEVLDLGVYLTTAIKCGKTRYSISSKTTENCSNLLESELDLLPQVEAILLMGDTAIKSMNYVAKRKTGRRIIPSGSTYKIRKQEYLYNDVRVYPTYLQTGKSYLIEKSKRKMIAEDINAALRH